jgi:hypothetical protein
LSHQFLNNNFTIKIKNKADEDWVLKMKQIFEYMVLPISKKTDMPAKAEKIGRKSMQRLKCELIKM